MEKIKNLSALRLVAFAVAIAIILGLSSVMLSFTASAETADDMISQLGTIGDYGCIKFRYDTGVLARTVIDRFNSYGTGNYVYGAVFGFKNGSFVQYVNNSINYCVGVDSVVFNNTTFYPSWLEKDTFSNTEFIFTESSNGKACSTYRYSTDNGYSYGSFTACAGALSLSDFINTYGDTFYAVFTSSSTSWSNEQFNSFKSDVINKYKDSDFKDSNSDSSNPRAEFVTCKSFTRDDGCLPLWFKDFTADGLQYPLFTYYISDNGAKHRYQLRLSYSSAQSDVVNTIFNNVNENNLSDQEKTLRELGQFLSGKLPVGSSNYTKFMALKPYMNLILKKPEYISFDEAFSLNSNQMNFENSETNGNKVYTICLSDYSDIVANYIYRAQLVDMLTSEILDTTYFVSNKTYHKGDSGTGAKIYDYGDDYDGMIDDLKNNTPSVTPGIDNKFSTTGDIIDMQDNNYLSGLKIDNIFSVLGQSASSIGAFFQACFNIVPSAILSILLSTLSLLIVLRVLGR